MDVRNLKTFLYAAELGGFTRAGEVLGYSQSTVSFQIKQLETELKVRLFERINRTVALTDAGREVLRYAQQMIRLTGELEKALKEEKSIAGHIRLAMADSLCPAFFKGDFKRFRRQYPHIALKIITAGTEEMFRLLDHNETDLVFTLDNHIYHVGYVNVWEEKISMHFVAGAAHPLARKAVLSIEDLLIYPFLLTDKGMSYRRLTDEKLAARSLEIVPVLEMGNTDQICRLVEEGVGISFLPDHVTKSAMLEGRLAYLPVADFDIDIWLQLLHHRDKWVSPAMEKVIGYCGEVKAALQMRLSP